MPLSTVLGLVVVVESTYLLLLHYFEYAAPLSARAGGARARHSEDAAAAAPGPREDRLVAVFFSTYSSFTYVCSCRVVKLLHSTARLILKHLVDEDSLLHKFCKKGGANGPPSR